MAGGCSGLSDQRFAKRRQCFPQAFREHFVCGLNFGSKSFEGNAERPGKFNRIDVAHESPFKPGRYFHWQLIDAATMDSRETVPNTSHCQSMIANAADHVFGLPQMRPGNAASSVEGVQPAEADDAAGVWRGKIPELVRGSEN
jgi:hypothetical protein